MRHRIPHLAQQRFADRLSCTVIKNSYESAHLLIHTRSLTADRIELILFDYSIVIKSKDGWYMACNIGFVGGGELFIIGRKNDTIIIDGRTFYPQNIEEIAFRHPAIRAGNALFKGERLKQVLVRRGSPIVVDVPAPQVTDNSILVEVQFSLISTGTEISGLMANLIA